MESNPSSQSYFQSLQSSKKNSFRYEENPQEEVSGKCCWIQKKINLPPFPRGCHLISDQIYKHLIDLEKFKVGLCHIQILHTSASLALNENWDPDVRKDMETFLSKLIPENTPFRHSCEGPEDMPAHIKACLFGSSLSISITNGRFNLGNWQGIWLCEHRNKAGSRKLMVTLNGLLKK